MKKITVLGTILLLALGLIACGGNDEPEREAAAVDQDLPMYEQIVIEDLRQDPDRVILTVNGRNVTAKEYLVLFDQGAMIFENIYGIDLDSEEGEEYYIILKEEVFSTALRISVLQNEFEKKDITLDEGDLEEEFQLIKEQYGSDEEFEEFLALEGLTTETYKEQIEIDLKWALLLEMNEEYNSLEVTEEEIEEYYQDYVQWAEEQEDEMIPELEELREDIVNVLFQDKKTQFTYAYLAQLIEEADYEAFF